MTVGFVTVMATSMKMTALWCTVSFNIIEIEDNSYETTWCNISKCYHL